MKNTERSKHFLLLQINDALFPIGGYSHSYGLETYIQKDKVRSTEEAWGYIERKLRYGLCYTELLAASLAYQSAREGDIGRLDRLEEVMEAARSPREIRQAGQKLGSRFIKTLKDLPIPYENDSFKAYQKSRSRKSTTHAIVYGVFCASVGIPYEEAMDHYLYAQTSSMITNCVKTVHGSCCFFTP